MTKDSWKLQLGVVVVDPTPIADREIDHDQRIVNFISAIESVAEKRGMVVKVQTLSA